MQITKYLYLLWLVTCLFIEFIVGHALAHLVYPLDICINILAILGINIDDSIQKFSLERNCASNIQILRFWHAITQTD